MHHKVNRDTKNYKTFGIIRNVLQSNFYTGEGFYNILGLNKIDKYNALCM